MRRWRAIGVVGVLAVLAALWFSRAEPLPEGPTPVLASTRTKSRPAPRRRVVPVPKPIPVPAAPRVDPAPAPAPEPDDGEVRCDVGDSLAGWPLRLFELDDGSPIGFHLEDGALVFEAPAPSGTAGLTWGHVRPHQDPEDSFGHVTWFTAPGGHAACSIDHLPDPLDAAVYGHVRGAEDLPDGSVYVEGCGAQERGEPAPVDAEGGFFLETQSGKCSMRAWRQAGMLRIPGPWVQVDASPGSDAEIELSVPTFEPAGMGIGFLPNEGGVTVTQVHDGSPAAEAGLEAGDTITAIDGVSTDGMGIEDFMNHGIGQAGTDVHVQGTSADGEPFDVTITRATIVD